MRTLNPRTRKRMMKKTLPKKRKNAVVYFNNAWYTLNDLTATIDCANDEAEGYLEDLINCEKRLAQATADLDTFRLYRNTLNRYTAKYPRWLSNVLGRLIFTKAERQEMQAVVAAVQAIQ